MMAWKVVGRVAGRVVERVADSVCGDVESSPNQRIKCVLI